MAKMFGNRFRTDNTIGIGPIDYSRSSKGSGSPGGNQPKYKPTVRQSGGGTGVGTGGWTGVGQAPSGQVAYQAAAGLARERARQLDNLDRLREERNITRQINEQDVPAGQTLDDLLVAMGLVPTVPTTSYTPSGGGSRGGGGGGSAQDLLARQQMTDATRSAYEQMMAALGQSGAAQLGAYDTQRDLMNSNLAAELAKVNSMTSGLSDQSQRVREQVGRSYSQAGQGIQDLAAQYAQMAAGRQRPAEQTLAAFGAGGAVSSPAMVQDLLTAYQANLLGQGQSSDALLAQRPEQYAQYGAERADMLNRQAASAQAALLAQRQQAEAQQARERAQLALEMQQALLRAQYG